VKSPVLLGLSVCLGLCLACVSVGREFPADSVAGLMVGKTTQAQVKETFGTPWRTGYEDGQRTWTYGRYRYSLFGPAYARDLVLKFDGSGVLRSYTYASTEPDT
jgi:outer membrane protein assembly factor BamE (lipoprotein component of BamABCDE complex)